MRLGRIRPGCCRRPQAPRDGRQGGAQSAADEEEEEEEDEADEEDAEAGAPDEELEPAAAGSLLEDPADPGSGALRLSVR